MSIDVGALREEVKAFRKTLQDNYAQDGNALALLRARSAQVDSVLTRLWQAQDFPATLTLAAVGGYGRGELYPASDIDLLILLPQEPNTPLQEKLERLIGHFWDIGLEIGLSVRTIQECLDEAGNDITVQTALLEARLLTGNQKLFSTFQKRLHGNLDPLVFFEATRLEQQERYLRFNETPYSLEPNCKESPGGLRDLQIVLWVSKAAKLGDNWKALAQNGLATAFEVRQIQRNEALQLQIRARLHLLAKRREDRLIFDLQTAVAEAFGVACAAARDLDNAVRWYRRAVAANDGSASVKSSEQLANLLARLAWERVAPPRRAGKKDPDLAQRIAQGRDDIQTAIGLLQALVTVCPTLERESLLGSAFKRLHRLELVAGQASAAAQAVQQMATDCAAARAPSRRSRCG